MPAVAIPSSVLGLIILVDISPQFAANTFVNGTVFGL